MVYSIHYLRGIAAIFVVFFHFRLMLNGVYAQKDIGNILFGGGFFGVDLFFMISGFVIAISTEKNNSKSSFLLKRIFRIYPVYLFTMFIFLIMYIGDINFWYVVRAIFFTQLSYNMDAPFFGYSVIAVAWTLSYEVLFYFIFLISMMISHKYRAAVCSVVIVASFALINLVFKNDNFLDAHKTIDYHGPFQPILKLMSSPMILEFVVGIILYYLYKSIKKYDLTAISKKIYPFLVLCLMILSLNILFNDASDHGIKIFGASCFLLIFILLLLDSSGFIGNNRALVFLGDISYSLYISHLVTKYALTNYVNISLLSDNGFLKFSVYVLISLIFAFILHKLIEIPFIRVCRKITTNKAI
ncbi:MAG: acyltransferase [Providencia alcalifaciens]|jgi:peptidoglycan/LPS O-acetylase OafA/YrhL|nr:acyltransferase [Providencia alcalifaciens]